MIYLCIFLMVTKASNNPIFFLFFSWNLLELVIWYNNDSFFSIISPRFCRSRVLPDASAQRTQQTGRSDLFCVCCEAADLPAKTQRADVCVRSHHLIHRALNKSSLTLTLHFLSTLDPKMSKAGLWLGTFLHRRCVCVCKQDANLHEHNMKQRHKTRKKPTWPKGDMVMFSPSKQLMQVWPLLAAANTFKHRLCPSGCFNHLLKNHLLKNVVLQVQKWTVTHTTVTEWTLKLLEYSPAGQVAKLD